MKVIIQRKRQGALWGVSLFFVVLVAGLFYVKWNPYYHKVLLAASKHFIGNSIITGKEAQPPAPSWGAAVNYAIQYFKSVWQAVVLGLLVGSLVQVLIPKDWIIKIFGSDNRHSTLVAGLMAVPSMMCSCCAAPVVAGLRKQRASLGAALAYWLGNPVLNPAVIIFTGFVLSWKFSLLRLVMGLVLVFGVSSLTGKLMKEDVEYGDIFQIDTGSAGGNLMVRWVKALWRLILESIPPYLIAVLLLGGVRAWLFPAVNPAWTNSILLMVVLSITGALFMIPTAAEIPIVQSLMSFGLGIGPASALFMTLPAVNVPSILMLRRYFPRKVLVLVFIAVIVCGIASGLLASILL
ncbi:permease [Desulfotomaculum nigrificans]|uniref:permease n=1 Tax=Desulfotomaculum nigrificans TaxID=1565 RepID=UPI001F31572F|nr:permease [Desulfotomaculum nigrificans]